MIQTPVDESTGKGANRVFWGFVVIFAVATALIVSAVASYLQGRENRDAIQGQNKTIQSQNTKIESLVGEVKSLSTENKKLTQLSVNYAYCNAVLTARYTQTGAPIEIEDLNKCILTVFVNPQDIPNVPVTGVELQQTDNIQNPSSVSPGAGSSSNQLPNSPPVQGGGGNSPNPQNPPDTDPNPPSEEQPRSEPIILLQPSKVLPLLNILPDVKVPGLLEVR